MSGSVSSPPRTIGGASNVPIADFPTANVTAINDDAAVYLALVDAIHGAAVGLSPAAQAMLRRGLKDRFGALFQARGDDAIDELIRLATEPRAA